MIKVKINTALDISIPLLFWEAHNSRLKYMFRIACKKFKYIFKHSHKVQNV